MKNTPNDQYFPVTHVSFNKQELLDEIRNSKTESRIVIMLPTNIKILAENPFAAPEQKITRDLMLENLIYRRNPAPDIVRKGSS